MDLGYHPDISQFLYGAHATTQRARLGFLRNTLKSLFEANEMASSISEFEYHRKTQGLLFHTDGYFKFSSKIIKRVETIFLPVSSLLQIQMSDNLICQEFNTLRSIGIVDLKMIVMNQLVLTFFDKWISEK
ncbi:hypothetical protein CEXT_590411 [Caerostris extrusa]|uniref:Uncharacterized protein n=1 Tax=Caerostris extrusa TaxID=172846 RepID=A0AAV4STN2_CAEEX|nr:hypothetical protein CEXT_590411 [Caerostris extrusa]